MVQETLGRPCALSPKDLLHPLLTTFGNFLFPTPLQGALVCKAGLESHVVSRGVPALEPTRKHQIGNSDGFQSCTQMAYHI